MFHIHQNFLRSTKLNLHLNLDLNLHFHLEIQGIFCIQSRNLNKSLTQFWRFFCLHFEFACENFRGQLLSLCVLKCEIPFINSDYATSLVKNVLSMACFISCCFRQLQEAVNIVRRCSLSLAVRSFRSDLILILPRQGLTYYQLLQ